MAANGPALPGRISRMKRVGLYVDDGASFETLLRSVMAEIDPDRAELLPLTAADVVQRDKLSACCSLVMPGGADLPYCRDLNGPGVDAIRRFVEAGGGFLGICASAYFACSALEFHKGRPDEVSGPRELSLVDALATGSLFEIAPPYDLKIASAGAARLDWRGLGRFRGYYHGGPTFALADGEDVEVIATYVDAGGSPAALTKPYGDGTVVLSGVHLEMDSTALQRRLEALTDGAAYRHLAVLLADSEEPRRRAFRDLLESARIPLRAF